VRNLEKNIAKLIRNTAKHIVLEEDYNKKLKPDDLVKIMGPEQVKKDNLIDNEIPGVVTGLAWTAVGGKILIIESNLSKGKGVISLTGNLGDVMKESATVAFKYLKANAEDLDIPIEIFEKYDVHIHVPEGAVPKDGPSAGITIFTALASLYTQRKIKSKLAMTGELTLRSDVLPVGGIKEKMLAAKRSGITEIIVSEDNRKDVEDIDEKYRDGLKFHYVKSLMEVIDIALLKTKVSNAKKFDLK
jgi:ATP-dependent Lon protease